MPGEPARRSREEAKARRAAAVLPCPAMSSPVRAVIIGCGSGTPGRGGAHSISYAHAEALRRSGVEVVGAASRTERNRTDFAAAFPGVRTYEDYRQMLQQERAEWVSVCAFPPQREEMVGAALEAGARLLLVEKPFAADVATARRMMAAATDSGARLFVAHQRRYGRPFSQFRDVVAGGGIGELAGIDIVQPTRFLMDFGPHLVDAALFAVGPRRVLRVLAAVDHTGEETRQGMPVEGRVIATVHLEGGVRLTIESGEGTPERMPIIRAAGTEGFAELHLDPPPGAPGVFRARLRGEPDVHCPASDETFHHGDVDRTLYFQRAVADVLDAWRRDRPSRIDASEALRGLEILCGIFDSARQGRAIEL